MSIEARIARTLYEEVWASTHERKSVKLALRIHDAQRQWPSASHDEIMRAYLIVYELLVMEVAEAIQVANSEGRDYRRVHG